MGRLPKDMRQLMAQAQKMQEELQRAQQELSDKMYEGTSGGGVVKATVKGSGEVVTVDINPDVLDPEDPELVGDLVVAAINQALAAVAEDAGDAFGGLADGLGGFPG